MADTLAMRLDLQALDDDALQKAIENQEALVNCTPLMEPMLLPALREYRGERDRRLDATVAIVLGNEGVVSDSEESNIATGRSRRVSHATDHYGNRVGSTKRPTLRDRMRKHPEFGAFVEQFEQNKATIKQNALSLACPLLVADEVARGNYNESDLNFLLRTQKKAVAMAADGHQYDFHRIKAYVRAHRSGQLRSPITNEPMSCEVHFMEPAQDKHGKKIKDTLVMRTWEPPLNVYVPQRSA